MEGFTSVEEAALKSDGGWVGLIGAKTMWRLGWDLFLFLKMNLALADEAALMSKLNSWDLIWTKTMLRLK